MRKKLIYFSVCLAFFIGGCRPALTIQDAVVNDVPNTKRLSGVSYTMNASSTPTFSSPNLNLTFIRSAEYQINTIITRDEYRNWLGPHLNAILFGGLLGLVGWGVSMDIEDDPVTPGNEAREGNKTLGGIIGLAGAPFLIWGLFSKEETVKKNKVKDGGTRTFEVVEPKPGITVSITNRFGLNKNIFLSQDNTLKANLITDLGLDYFENINNIDLTLHLKDFTHHKFSVNLNLSDFLSKFIRVKADVACLRESPSANSRATIGLPSGGRAKFLKEADGWVQVLLNDQVTGYLKVQDVDFYYSRETKVISKTIDCANGKDFVADKARAVVANYFDALNFIGNPLYDKEEKEIASDNCIRISFKDPNLLIFNDLNFSNKKLKYRKVQEYFYNIPGTFKELAFKHTVIDVTYDSKSGVGLAKVSRSVEGTHFQDGHVSNSAILNFKFRFALSNYEFGSFFIEDILPQ